MGGYAPPPPDEWRPATRAEADARNAIGNENRAKYNLGAYGEAEQYYAAQRVQQSIQQTRQDIEQQNQREMQATGGGPGFRHTSAYNEAQGRNAGTGVMPVDPILDSYQSRPRYTAPEDLGNRATQKAVSGADNKFAAIGVELEKQRQAATTTHDRMFYENELAKWNAQRIEQSAGEHAYKKQSLNPNDWTANTRENVGDIALAFEKAGNQKDNFGKNYAFNPNVRSVLTGLPQYVDREGNVSPVGLQDYAWRSALGREGKEQVGTVSFMPAVEFINAQEGRMGVYGNLKGGVPDPFAPLPAGAATGGRIGPGVVAGNAVSASSPANSGTIIPKEPFISTFTGTNTYQYRSDPVAVVLEGAAFLGDSLTFGLWKPGSAQLTKYGQNTNRTNDIFNARLADVQRGHPAHDLLGTQIQSEQSAIAKMLEGKVNAEGKFTGSTEEFAAYQSAFGKLSSDITQYNKYNTRLQIVITGGYASGAIISTGDNKYIVNPDNVKEYGAFSDWSAGAGRFIQRTLGQTPATAAQFAAYEQTPEFKNAGPIMQIGEGGYKVLATNPASLAGSFLQGVEIYTGMGLLNAGFATAAASGTGTVSTVGKGGQYVLNSRPFQYGLGIALVGGTIWSDTAGFTNEPSRSYSNIGGSATHLTAMLVGGYTPEGLARAPNLIRSGVNLLDSRMAIPMANEEAVLGNPGYRTNRKTVYLPGWETTAEPVPVKPVAVGMPRRFDPGFKKLDFGVKTIDVALQQPANVIEPTLATGLPRRFTPDFKKLDFTVKTAPVTYEGSSMKLVDTLATKPPEPWRDIRTSSQPIAAARPMTGEIDIPLSIRKNAFGDKIYDMSGIGSGSKGGGSNVGNTGLETITRSYGAQDIILEPPALDVFVPRVESTTLLELPGQRGIGMNKQPTVSQRATEFISRKSADISGIRNVRAPDADIYDILKAEAKPVSPATMDNAVSYKSALWKQYYELPGTVDMSYTKGDSLAHLREMLHARTDIVVDFTHKTKGGYSDFFHNRQGELIGDFQTKLPDGLQHRINQMVQNKELLQKPASVSVQHRANLNERALINAQINERAVMNALAVNAMQLGKQGAVQVPATASKGKTLQQIANVVLPASGLRRHTQPVQTHDYSKAFDTMINPVSKTTPDTRKQPPAEDYSRVFNIPPVTKPPVKPPEQPPYKEPWPPIVPDSRLPGFPIPSGSSGGGGGGGGGRLSGFVFTEKLVVKSAREIMFGKTKKKIDKKLF